ncbi:MAG: hypothetical protein ABSD21_07040 [Rhizomicrobium sp.]|jgi:hypothetical protein
MSALLDIWHTIQGIISHADWITLAIIAVVAIVAGFAIQSFNSILSATVLGLVGYVLLVFVRAVTLGKQDLTAYAHTGWHDVLGLQMITLLAYFVLFAVLIAAVHLIRSAVLR